MSAPDCIDLDLAIKNPAELKKLQLDPGESRWVAVSDQRMALIKSLGRGKSIIFLDEAYDTKGEDLAFIAGSITQEDAIATNDGQLTYKVSVRPSPTRDFEAKAQAGIYSTTLQLGNKPKEYHLICSCCTPQISHEHNQRIGTELSPPCSCGDVAHPNCLPHQVRDKLEQDDQYTCTPCFVKEVSEGVVWAEKPTGRDQERITNTCTIDNFLTGVNIFTHQQNPQLSSFFPDDQQHRNLKETMASVERKEYGKAQRQYYEQCQEMNEKFLALPDTKKMANEIKEYNKTVKEVKKRNKAVKERNKKIEESNTKNPHAPPQPLEPLEVESTERQLQKPITQLLKNNLWGEAFTRVNDKHLKGFQVERISSCSNMYCPKGGETRKSISPIVVGTYINDDHARGVEDLQAITEEMHLPCDGCSDMETQNCLVAPKDHWALSFDLSSVSFDKRDKVKADIANGKLPDTISLKNSDGGQNVYGLASVTLQDKNHFVSLQYIPSRGEFVFYDGMEKTRIRKMHPSDIMDAERKVYSVDYFRLS